MSILTERSDVNPDRADDCGRTPLSFAAEYGDRKIVQILVKRNDVNPGRADETGRTPLSWASSEGHEEIVKLLLERNSISPATAGGSSQALSLVAAGSGYEGIAGVVSQQSDVNSEPGNMSAQPQLSCDSIFGHGEIVDMLWEQSNISPDPIPATGSGYEGDMDLSLDSNNANRDTADEIGGMTFVWAPGGASEAVPETPFEPSDVSPNPAHPFSQTPFPRATENEYARVAQLVEDPYDLFDQLPSEGLFSEPFSPEPSEIPEPPLKRIRRL